MACEGAHTKASQGSKAQVSTKMKLRTPTLHLKKERETTLPNHNCTFEALKRERRGVGDCDVSKSLTRLSLPNHYNGPSIVPESRQIKGLVGRIGGFGLEPRKFNVLLFGWARVYILQWD